MSESSPSRGVPVPDDAAEPGADVAPDDAAEPGADDDAATPGALAGPDLAGLIDPATIRRAPRYGRFALAGVTLGALAAGAVVVLGPANPAIGAVALFLLLFLAFGTVGALLGTGAAVLADRRSLRDRRRPPSVTP